MTDKLTGKTAIVTGSSRGIGAAIAEQFAADGANVVVNSRNLESAAETASRIEMNGGTAEPVEADVSDPTNVASLVDATEEEFGGIDILVNNAGISDVKPVMEMTPEDWTKVLDVNLSSVFYCSQEVARRMIEQNDGGQIINISSIFAQVGIQGRASYGAAKGGIDALTRMLAVELSEYGICVNALAPGPILTEMVEKAGSQQDGKVPPSGWPRYSFGEKEVQNWTLLGRYGRPDEIGNWAAFLAAGDHYSTGNIFTVDGGWLAFGWGSKSD